MAHLFGLIGQQIAYSRSPEIMAGFFVEANIMATYQLFDLPTIELVTEVFAQNPKGLNVTQPYKTAIIPYLDDLDEAARKIGAINTIAFKAGKRIGYNTDVFGFSRAITPFLTSNKGTALIIGSGGAAKAAEYVCWQLGMAVDLVSRQPAKNQLAYEDLSADSIGNYALIVQCTPLGSPRYPGQMPPIPMEGIQQGQLVFDMVYTPAITPFLAAAAAKGAQTLNGETMLYYQAAAAWEIWRETLDL